jgi:hypothetical protein
VALLRWHNPAPDPAALRTPHSTRPTRFFAPQVVEVAAASRRPVCRHTLRTAP